MMASLKSWRSVRLMVWAEWQSEQVGSGRFVLVTAGECTLAENSS